MPYFLYILLLNNNVLYVGVTDDFRQAFERHTGGHNEDTKHHEVIDVIAVRCLPLMPFSEAKRYVDAQVLYLQSLARLYSINETRGTTGITIEPGYSVIGGSFPNGVAQPEAKRLLLANGFRNYIIGDITTGILPIKDGLLDREGKLPRFRRLTDKIFTIDSATQEAIERGYKDRCEYEEAKAIFQETGEE